MEASLDILTTSLTTLSHALAPLLAHTPNATTLSTTSPFLAEAAQQQQQQTELTLLDRAKLYTTQAYAIESLLFSALRLASTHDSSNAAPDLQSHPVMIELARIRQYFAKLDEAEKGRQGPRLRVDRGAAGRIVRAGLVDAAARTDIPLHDKRKAEAGPSIETGQSESARQRKKDRKSHEPSKKKSDKVPKGPKEAFQALINKKK